MACFLIFHKLQYALNANSVFSFQDKQLVHFVLQDYIMPVQWILYAQVVFKV